MSIANIKRYAMRDINLKHMEQQTDSFEFKDENARFGIKDEWMNKPLHIGGQKQQTAVDWLFIQLYEKFEMKGDGIEMDKVLEQAKQMEKEQIMDAHIEGQRVFDKHPHTHWTNDQAEQYYNETYKK